MSTLLWRADAVVVLVAMVFKQITGLTGRRDA